MLITPFLPLSGSGDLAERRLAGAALGFWCDWRTWHGLLGLPGLKPVLDIGHQEPGAAGTRQIDGWGEVLRPKIVGVAHRPGVGADGGGQLWEGYRLAGAGIHGCIFPKGLRHARRKNGTFLRFLSTRVLGINLIPMGVSGGRLFLVHANCRHGLVVADLYVRLSLGTPGN